MGAIADAFYVQFMNFERHSEPMVPDPNGIRKLPAILPTKFAVLMTLSKNCYLSARAIKVTLYHLGYFRSLSSIRRALGRCVKFGLAQKMDHFKHETGVLRGNRRPHRHNKWKLTERGKQVACSDPSKFLKGKKKQAYAEPNKAVPSTGSEGRSEGSVPVEPNKVLGP